MKLRCTSVVKVSTDPPDSFAVVDAFMRYCEQEESNRIFWRH
jgi:hypothetical protein